MAPILAPAAVPATANAAMVANGAANAGAGGMVTAISCAPGGTCAAGGQYQDASLGGRAFVVTRRNGHWGTAIEVPGLAALHPTDASVTAMSCVAGGCVAGGYYQIKASRSNAFVTSEKNGQWSRLTTILSTRSGPLTGHTAVRSLSCSGPGSCTAGGQPAFVVNEVHGRWGKPRRFPTKDPNGRIMVSCASAGNCTAGWWTFLDKEQNGHWRKVITVPGLTSGTAQAASGRGISSISCTSAGDCLVGGLYPSSHRDGVFVASERGGRWGKAMPLPHFNALNQTSTGLLAAVSCLRAGDCVAAGSYTADADFAGGVYEPFVASERNGHWGNAIEVPGIPPPGNPLCEPDSSSCVAGQVLSASCAPGGTCAAGGWYDTVKISGQAAFVVTYDNGRWTKVTQIPGLAADAGIVNSVSCTSTDACAAGGSSFVVNEMNGIWGHEHTVVVGG